MLVFPPENLWRGFGIAFDPEGLLSTLPAVVNVVAGYIAGVFIQKSGNTMSTVWKLLIIGFVFVIIAEAWSLAFPINKPIWTSSYVVLTIGWDLVLSGVFVMLMNILYIEGGPMKTWLYRNLYQSWLSDYNASLMFAITYVFLLWLIGYWMDRREIYIEV